MVDIKDEYEETKHKTTFKSFDGTMKIVITPHKYPQCLASGHSSVDHPIKLDLEFIRKHIPHIKGKNRPNNRGFLLCFGNCSWNRGDCSGASLFCLNCGYTECWGCAEDFCNSLEELYSEWEGHGISNYCRGCGKHGEDTIVEIYNQEWLEKQIGIIKNAKN